MDGSEVPYGTNITRPIWVCKIERDGRFKAHLLCVDGNSQRYGQDFDQTHASALRIVSLRCLAAIQSREGLRSARIDLVSAYLEGDLEKGEVIDMHQPQGYQINGADGRPRVCMVLKPVYGFRQGGRRLQRKLFP